MMHKSMNLEYEPSSEPLHISAKPSSEPIHISATLIGTTSHCCRLVGSLKM